MKQTWTFTALIALAPLLANAQEKPTGTAPPQATGGEKSGDAKKPFTVGNVVDSSITLTDITGKKHTLKDYLGKTVLIDFWSIECPVSKGYEARLKKVHADYEKKGVVFLAVNANAGEVVSAADSHAPIKDYVKKESIPYPVLLDVGNVVADRFDAKTTPHIFILDGKGTLRYAGGVDDDPDFKKGDGAAKSYVREALDALLAGKEPPQSSTKPHGCSIKRVATKN